jgi:hypothetical protein
MNATINDLNIHSPYRVYDLDTGHYVFSWLDTNAWGDIPPDIATLPVVGLRAMNGVLYIDTRTGNRID